MCNQPGERKHEFTGLIPKRRLKLWELKSDFGCIILGTCLSMDDLRKVMRQSGVTLEKDTSDYGRHVTMVASVGEKSIVSRNLHKMLDRKYQRWIKTLTPCKEETELEKHWQAAMSSGEIAGPFWSLMTHPRATPELIHKAFEDVHMLSHLQGASNRADLKRMKRLEIEVAELQAILSETRQNHKGQIARRDELIRRQEQELLALMTKNPYSESTKEHAAQNSEMEKQNRVLAKRAGWVENKLAEREMSFAEVQEEIARLKELLAEAREEHAVMERAMTLLHAEKNPGDTEQSREIDLQGKQVLYVGGLSRLAPHLRSIVEAHNGHFSRHDGGLEESLGALQCNLAGADMVFCPIDCISHDACLRVKRHCQQQAKQFIPLRSSGVSAFAAGLMKYSTRSNDQNLMAETVVN